MYSYPIAYLKFGSARFAMSSAGVAAGGAGSPPRAVRCRSRRLWCLRPSSSPPAAAHGRRMWDRGDVGRRKVGSAHALLLVWRVDPARRVAPRAASAAGRGARDRIDYFGIIRWVVLTTATG